MGTLCVAVADVALVPVLLQGAALSPGLARPPLCMSPVGPGALSWFMAEGGTELSRALGAATPVSLVVRTSQEAQYSEKNPVPALGHCHVGQVGVQGGHRSSRKAPK